MSSANPDARTIAVVGAGIVGAACALRLARAGHAVTLIDREGPGRGCSRGHAALIATHATEPLSSPETLKSALRYLFGEHAPLAIHPRYLLRALPWMLRFALATRRFEEGTAALAALQEQSLAAFTRLLDDAGLESLLKARGHLMVTETREGRATLTARQKVFDGRGIKSRWLDRNDIEQLAPGLSPAVMGGLYFADTAHVTDPLRVCRGLAIALERAGGVVEKAEVHGIEARGERGFTLAAGERSFDCDIVIVAAGAWSGPLARQLGHRVPLDTERGYNLTTDGWYSDLTLPVGSLERHTYLAPLASGLRITGFSELGGVSLPPVSRRFDKLREHLHALVPAAELSGSTEWMGHRPSLPDHLPVIGRSSRHPGALFAFGHQHLGLTLSAVTAEIIEALVAGREPPVDPAPFRIERFQKAAAAPPG